jgi:hypothetical protein
MPNYLRLGKGDMFKARAPFYYKLASEGKTMRRSVALPGDVFIFLEEKNLMLFCLNSCGAVSIVSKYDILAEHVDLL